MNSGFATISQDVWVIRNITSERYGRLTRGTSFERIIKSMSKVLKVADHFREGLDDYDGYYRPVIKLRFNTELVDLFFNSVSGYRAQYYKSEKNGEAANRFAIDTFTPLVIKELDGSFKRTCPEKWVKSSLEDDKSKLWIHQGLWLHHARREDRKLLVERWIDNLNDETKKKVLWGKLIPRHESIIELKGSPLRIDGKFLNKSLKPNRSFHIHGCGFT